MASMERPAKRAKLLSDSESSSDEADFDKQPSGELKINADFARKFEHNKKREEKDRLEEKYGKASAKNSKSKDDLDEEDEDSSDDESEDDDAELATKDLDAEIEDTLAAIRNKDPRVYNTEVKFYKEYNPDASETNGVKKEKSMSLHDYHRRNLMEGFTGDDEDEAQAGAARTYAQDQEDIKQDLIGDMHAKATNGEAADSDDDDDDDFMVRKSRPTRNELLAQLPAKEITDADVAAADNDPQTYLSNFMAARAWLPTATSKWTAFDSDDSEDEKRADEFEEAYNLRFEDPEHANEKLMTFSRDTGKYSVRRDDVKGGARKRAREREKEKKAAEKKERQEERKRLRDLRVEETAEKVKKIREAAGMSGKQVNIDDWRDVLDGDFDDEKWEQEMKNRFGETYYAAEEEESFSEPEIKQEHGTSKKQKLKKPTWNDDIDINDLVPEFEKEEASKPAFTLSSDEGSEDEEDGGVPIDAGQSDEEDTAPPAKRKSKKDHAKEKADARRAARIDRRKIEEMVDANLSLDHPSLAAGKEDRPVVGFRYRETSPTSFGMTSRDILFADDTQLNQFAGLKKMAAFRDEERKRRDKKRYSKKGRLREWRKEVFGSKDEPNGGFEKVLGNGTGTGANDVEIKVESEGSKGKKRKRSKKQKQGGTTA